MSVICLTLTENHIRVCIIESDRNGHKAAAAFPVGEQVFVPVPFRKQGSYARPLVDSLSQVIGQR